MFGHHFIFMKVQQSRSNLGFFSKQELIVRSEIRKIKIENFEI